MTTIQFLPLLFIAAFWIFGVNYAFQTGEILGKPGDWIRAYLPKYIVKPTIGCVKCMASIHGTAFYIMFQPYNIVLHIVFVVSLCGLNYILDAIGYE